MNKNTPRYIELSIHTPYSCLEGMMTLEKVAKMCENGGMPAVGITDTTNICAALEYSIGLAKRGIQPIIGMKVPSSYLFGDDAVDGSVKLYAMNEIGYANLLKIASTFPITGGRDAKPFRR